MATSLILKRSVAGAIAQSLPLVGAEALAWVGSRFLHDYKTDNKELSDDGARLANIDASERTFDSMTEATNKYRELGEERENVLQQYYESYRQLPSDQFSDMLTAYRGGVILMTAFGESRLAHGTKVRGEEPTFILTGADLDLGADALRPLVLSYENINRAKAETEKLSGQIVNGKEVEISEIAELDKMQARVAADILKVYGKHDLKAATNELAQYYQSDYQGFVDLQRHVLNEGIDLNRNSDVNVQAKLYRDYALLMLAVCSVRIDSPDAARLLLYGSDNGRGTPFLSDGTPRGFDGALDAIRLAEQLSPDNADNAELKQLAQELIAKLPASQQNPSIFNPLATPTP